jgi:polyisoprenoid-binding protein YceI
VHLHVADLATAEAFYHVGLGFDKVVWSYPGALFLSAGGYHHHLGTNTWSASVPPANDQARLLSWDLEVPTRADADAAARSLESASYQVDRHGDVRLAADPWGTTLRIVPNRTREPLEPENLRTLEPSSKEPAMSLTATAIRTYYIDKSHSEATFQVRHLLTKVRGRFSDFEGTIDLDELHPERSSVSVTIQAASIDTNEPARDAHLRSADFFAADEFAAVNFTSTQIVPAGDDRFDVTGDITIRGVTKRIVVPVTVLGKAKDPWGNERLAFEAEFTINRKEFGLNWNAALETGGFLVGDDVRVTLSVQALAK